MFGKRKKPGEGVIVPAPTSTLLASLVSRSVKETPINDFEKQFFIALEESLHLEGLSVEYFTAERMSSGSIRLNCPAGIIGIVHLRKRFGSIQYFISPLDIHDMTDAPVEAIMVVIPYWIEYAKGCIRLRKAATTV